MLQKTTAEQPVGKNRKMIPRHNPKRYNILPEEQEPEQSYISKLLSNLSEEMLWRLVFGISVSTPSIRRPIVRAIWVTYLLGILTTVTIITTIVIIYKTW